MLNVGLVGLGEFAKFVSTAVKGSKSVRITAGMDIDKCKAKKFKENQHKKGLL